jgi:two-component system nitrogen regulation response regulator GlnG
MPTLLVIDDDDSILYAFREVFRGPAVTFLTAANATEGLKLVSRRRPDVVILDISLPDMSGLDAYRHVREIDAKVPVIFITAHGTTNTAIEAMKLGAFDYLLKPLELDELCPLVERAFEISRQMRVPAMVADEIGPVQSADVLVGRCPGMQKVYKQIGRVAPQDVTVLILGESGTGKELVARAIYHHSNRSSGPFLTINCAAIPETLLESELFGHEKGSFTGADRKRIGKFEQCNGGTLFLDEIGDMTPLTQTKILRVLQEQRFERVGGNETIQTNVRLIAATNRDLDQMVAAGNFRSDLYYRLSVFTIQLPPLRERLDDLPLLIDHFVRRFARELGKDVHSVHPELLELLRRYSWPGNLRELQSVIKQALLQAAGPVLCADFLSPALRGDATQLSGVQQAATTIESQVPATPNPAAASAPDIDQFISDRLDAGSENLHDELIAHVERHLILRVLQRTDGNQVQAARVLGIDRGSLRSKILTLDIVVERSVR